MSIFNNISNFSKNQLQSLKYRHRQKFTISESVGQRTFHEVDLDVSIDCSPCPLDCRNAES